MTADAVVADPRRLSAVWHRRFPGAAANSHLYRSHGSAVYHQLYAAAAVGIPQRLQRKELIKCLTNTMN